MYINLINANTTHNNSYACLNYTIFLLWLDSNPALIEQLTKVTKPYLLEFVFNFLLKYQHTKTKLITNCFHNKLMIYNY